MGMINRKVRRAAIGQRRRTVVALSDSRGLGSHPGSL